MDKDIQLAELADQMCEVPPVMPTFNLECAICSHEEEFAVEQSGTGRDAAKQAFQKGWRHVSSVYWGLEGIVCPKCLEEEEEEGRAIELL